MPFLSDADYSVVISALHLQQMTRDEPTARDFAEDMAVAAVKDALVQRYDAPTIFSTPADHPNVRRWVAVIAVYYLYQRLPDRMTPERITADYEATVEHLARLSDGKRSADLPRRVLTDEGGNPANFSTFRGDFRNRRSH